MKKLCLCLDGDLTLKEVNDCTLNFYPRAFAPSGSYYWISSSENIYHNLHTKMFPNTNFPLWFQIAFWVRFNFSRFLQPWAGPNNEFWLEHDVGNPQEYNLIQPIANMGSSLDTANLFIKKNWKMLTTEIGL